jgi:protease I
MPRRVLFVIAPERFRDEELIEPRKALEAAGHVITIASTRPCTAAGMLGASVSAAGFSEVASQNWDAIVVVGGSGSPDHLWTFEPLLAAIRNHKGVTAAICLSGAVLARAGVLAGKRATVYASPRAIAELKRGGAAYVDEPVVHDGRILTASGPEAAAAFGSALVQLLGP